MRVARERSDRAQTRAQRGAERCGAEQTGATDPCGRAQRGRTRGSAATKQRGAGATGCAGGAGQPRNGAKALPKGRRASELASIAGLPVGCAGAEGRGCPAMTATATQRTRTEAGVGVGGSALKLPLQASAAKFVGVVFRARGTPASIRESATESILYICNSWQIFPRFT